MKATAITPKPANFIFDKERTNFTLGGEESISFVLDQNKDGTLKIAYEENVGILNYYYGVPYPSKGFVTPEAMFALNQMKRLILEATKLAQNPLIFVGAYVSRKKVFASANTVFEKILGSHSIKSVYMCRAAYAVEQFTFALTGDEKFSHFIAQIPEYDDSYRYRMQDMFTELNVEWFKQAPRKEVARLMKLWKSREGAWSFGVFNKVEYALKVVKLLLLIPSIRKKVCENIHLLKIGEYDENDQYWMCLYDHGYDYLGLPIEVRSTLYEEKPYAYRIKV